MLTRETRKILRNNTKQKMTSVRKKNGNKILNKTSQQILNSIKKPTPSTAKTNNSTILSSSSLEILNDVKDGLKYKKSTEKNILSSDTMTILQSNNPPNFSEKIKEVTTNISNMIERGYPLLEIEKKLKLHKIRWNQLHDYILIDLHEKYGSVEVHKIISSNDFNKNQTNKYLYKCVTSLDHQISKEIWEKIIVEQHFLKYLKIYISHYIRKESFNLDPFLMKMYFLKGKKEKIEVITHFLTKCEQKWSSITKDIAFAGVKLIKALNIKIWSVNADRTTNDALWNIVKTLDKDVAEFKSKYSVFFQTTGSHWKDNQNHSLFQLKSLNEYNEIRSKSILLEAIKRDHLVWCYTNDSVKTWLETYVTEKQKYNNSVTVATILGGILGGAMGVIGGGAGAAVGAVGGGIAANAITRWLTAKNFTEIFTRIEGLYTSYFDEIVNKSREDKEKAKEKLKKSLITHRKEIIDKISENTTKYFLKRDLDKIDFVQLSELILKQSDKIKFLKNQIVSNDQWYNTCIRKNLSKTQLIVRSPPDARNTDTADEIGTGFKKDFNKCQSTKDGRWQHVNITQKYQFASEVQHVREMCETTVDLIKENKISHSYSVLLDSQYMYYDTTELSVELGKNIDLLSNYSSKSFGQFESVCQVYWSELNQNISKEFLQQRNSNSFENLINLQAISNSVLNLQRQIAHHITSSAQNTRSTNQYIENVGQHLNNIAIVQSRRK